MILNCAEVVPDPAYQSATLGGGDVFSILRRHFADDNAVEDVVPSFSLRSIKTLVECINPQICFGGLGIMTLNAVTGKNRLDFPFKLDACFGRIEAVMEQGKTATNDEDE